MLAQGQRTTNQDFSTLLSQAANGLWALGIFGVIQNWATGLYAVGLVALAAALAADALARYQRGDPLPAVAERVTGLLVALGVGSIVQWWRPGLYDAGLVLLLASLVAYPLTMLWNQNEWPEVLERLSNILLALGALGVVQWWQPMELYWIGRALLVAGFAANVGGMLAARVDIANILQQAGLLLLLAGSYGVFQWRRMEDYEIGLWLLQAGFVSYVLGVFLSRAGIVATLERACILLIIFGMLAMFQPWEISHYEDGFYLVGLSTLAFIIVSHIPQREALSEE